MSYEKTRVVDINILQRMRFRLRAVQSDYLRRQRCYAAALYLQGTVLDLGCDTAGLLRFIKNESNYVGVDIRKEAVEALRITYPACTFYCIDICENDQLVNSIQSKFDTIVLLATIEHLLNPLVTLNQCYKFLKGQGRLVITTPTPTGDKIAQFVQARIWFMSQGPFPHVHIYNKLELKHLLEASGFNVQLYRTFVFGLNQLIVGVKNLAYEEIQGVKATHFT